MKKKFLFFSLLSSMVLNAQDIFISEKLEKMWETTNEFKTPESVCYDAVKNLLYVSNLSRGTANESTDGFISKLSFDGKILELKWVEGLNSPTGMGIYEDKLYVAELAEVTEINLNTGKVLKKYKVEGAKFLNDVTIGSNGEVYISDSGDKMIYIIKDGVLSLWVQDDRIKGVNGVWYEKDRILAGAGGKVYSIGLKDKEIVEFIDNIGNVDGLVFAGNGGYLLSDWSGNVYLTYPGQEKEKLLSTASAGVNAADIEYIMDKKLLFVPTFNDNRVACYKLK